MKKHSRIVIVGAGGQGRIVADILRAGGTTPLGFVDDTPALHRTVIDELPVFGAVSALGDVAHDAVIVAIGDNFARRVITERLTSGGEQLATAIHPFTSIASTARIGEGSMISAGAIVLPNATLGRGVLLNTRCSVDHDSVVGDFAHVGVGTNIGAYVRIGEQTMIAMGVTVISAKRVGARSIVGAGAVVVSDLDDDVKAFGVPARVRST